MEVGEEVIGKYLLRNMYYLITPFALINYWQIKTINSLSNVGLFGKSGGGGLIVHTGKLRIKTSLN